MDSPVIRIATRKSKLALLQAELAKAMILRVRPGALIELVPIVSSGDKIIDRPLAEVGGKGLFTKEIEEALLCDAADIAVHSVKDMEWKLPDGLALAAILPREDARDALVSAKYTRLIELPPGAVVGTASLRRASQLKNIRPDLQTSLLRGNVPTRIEKIERGEYDATLLAMAGLKRLGLGAHAKEIFETQTIMPAVAQGAIGIECRADDNALVTLLGEINHEISSQAVTAERAMLRVLDGSCRTPIGGFAEISDGQLRLRGEVLSPDGSERYTEEGIGEAADASALGERIGAALKAKAGHILALTAEQ